MTVIGKRREDILLPIKREEAKLSDLLLLSLVDQRPIPHEIFQKSNYLLFALLGALLFVAVTCFIVPESSCQSESIGFGHIRPFIHIFFPFPKLGAGLIIRGTQLDLLARTN